MGLHTRRKVTKGVSAIIALFFTLWLVFPPFWMFITSFKESKDAISIPPRLIFNPTIKNYVSIFNRPDFGKVFTNTVIASAVSSVLVLIIGSMAAYSMARFNTGGSPAMFGTLLFRVLPPIVIGLPFYIIFSRIGLLDTLTGLTIAYIAILLPNTIWLLIPFYRDIPLEVEESGLVDGCTRFGVFLRIVLPLARPGLIVTGIYTIMGAWNHFFFGLILTSFNARTLPIEASNFVGEYALQWGEVSAIGSILIVPPILIAFCLQKYLVKGLTLGAVKG